MSEEQERTRVRTAPGWWSNLVRAECPTCSWHGPLRDTNETMGLTRAQFDAREHDDHHAGVR